jgi:tRNA pseudouridine38-40 synthase
VPAGFQPSTHATSKTYCYNVLQGTIRDPFYAARSWRVFERLNHANMAEAAQSLLGTHDFRAFRGRGDIRENTVRTLTGVAVALSEHHDRLLEIRVTGNAFLYHMMRIIAGTLVDVGRGKAPMDAFDKAFSTGDRLMLGVTAPAAGLFLEKIEMDELGEEQWPYHLDGAPIRQGSVSGDTR